MSDYGVGDRVRIDIPDETDSDHRRYHGRHGTIIAVIPASPETPSGEDVVRFRVDLDAGSYADFSVRDLRPPITG